MDTTQNADQHVEIKKVRQLLAKNIDDFKYLVLCNMRLEENSRPSTETLRLDVNRISGFEEKPTENLEEWVNKEFASKGVAKIKPKNTKSSVTIIDFVEQWLMNEAKKDLFAQMDAIYGGPEGLSSEYIRALGTNLISLADKLDRMKS